MSELIVVSSGAGAGVLSDDGIDDGFIARLAFGLQASRRRSRPERA
jgi:uncharacterized membrane protein